MTDQSAYDAALIECHEANFAYRLALARVLSDDALVALPQDVRDARAALAVEAEARRAKDAAITLDRIKSAREDRWIVAHEYAAAWRRDPATS